MKTNCQAGNDGKYHRGWAGVMALGCFVAGALLTAGLTHLHQVRADSPRVFELMVYHTVPGKVPALESIFRDVSKLQAKHGLQVLGYWVPNEGSAWANTFLYIVTSPSREAMKKNWDALHADPAFPEYRKRAAELIEKEEQGYRVDEVYMRPSDFSAIQ